MIIAYAMGIYHYYGSSDYAALSFSAFSIWMNVANGTLEITGSSLGKSMSFKPGQFAFLKIKGGKNNFTSHPFTISEAPKEGEIPQNYSIDFFYAYNNSEEGAYVEELKNLVNNKNVRLHLINSKEKGFLTVDKILQEVKVVEKFDAYFCGPKPMKEALRKQFEGSKVSLNELHYENFQFK